MPEAMKTTVFCINSNEGIGVASLSPPRPAEVKAMYLGEEVTLYKNDGTPFTARMISYKQDDDVADGLIYEGRLIYCQNNDLGLFWFADTKEMVFEFPPTG
jgi:hypothetical protein